MSFFYRAREQWRRLPQAEEAALAAAILAISLSLLLALPSLFIPLGLSTEGDAVDYRIPIVRWILRHGALPNWQWTMVDDYPMLGEFLMLPLYWVSPALARLVPLGAYVASGFFGGLLCQSLGRSHTQLRPQTLFFLGFAWTISLRPLALLSNALLMDNLASAFSLGALAFVLRSRFALAGLCAAIAMATRYTSWASAAFLPVLVLVFSSSGRRRRDLFLFCAIAMLGPLPFMVRNFFWNQGHIFYPLDVPEVIGPFGLSNYGRGKDLLSLLFFPFDLLYTNSFVRGFYDYTVGKLFYIQLAFAAALVLKKKSINKAGEWKSSISAGAFAFVSFIAWFYSSQQLRFLVPSLVVFNIFLLLWIARSNQIWILAGITLLGIFSSFSIQRESIELALGKRATIFQDFVDKAKDCFARANVGDEVVGFDTRANILGFFDQDFYFTPESAYGVRIRAMEMVPWLYSVRPTAGYELWPKERPCMSRRIAGGQG